MPIVSSWRRPASAGRVIAVLALCMVIWLLFDAVNLQRSAESSPVGARRTASLDVIGPVAVASRYTGFAGVDRGLDALLGRRPGLLPAASGSVHQVMRPPAHLRTIAFGLASLGNFGQWPKEPGQAITEAGTRSERAAYLPQPTAAHPLRVLIIGDSVGEDMGQSLSNDLFSTGVVTVDLDAHSSTGLARPDYFNWPSEVQQDVASFAPQVTVAMFGGNDGQGFVQNGQVYSFGTPEWEAAYGVRVDQVISMLEVDAGTVVWVGMPPMQDSTLSKEMGVLNGIYQDRVAMHPRTYYISTSTVLGDQNGGYQAFLPDRSGQLQQVRQDDGVHLTTDGGRRVASVVEPELTRVLGVRLGGLP